MTKFLFFQLLPRVPTSRLESAKRQNLNALIKELKLYANFLESAHQCKTDIVPVAGVLGSLLASYGETTNSARAPWLRSGILR